MKLYIFKSVSFLMIAGFFLFLNSCSEKSKNEFSKTKRSSQVDPSNNTNSFDYVGISHNIKLRAFVEQSENIVDSSPINNVYNHFHVTGLPSESEMVEVIQQANLDPSNYSGFMKNLYDNNQIIFSHYLNVRAIVNDNITLSEKVSNIIQYETDLNYLTFNDQERMALKSMFSVARHSMCLWASNSEGGEGYNSRNKNKYIGGNKNTHDIVMADIGGTITSAIFTWNPFTALAGGALSSAWEWANQ